uniref:BTB domain-containing protein n=1 Tax=Strongyloides papillosus TaxID=174720 RepID=A0A0N5B5S9_STREA
MITSTNNDERTSKIINFNVGGISFRCRLTTLLSKKPKGRLGIFASYNHDERLKYCDGYIFTTKEYYFERSAKLFDIIYKYYVQGTLHKPLDLCEEEFISELDYWEIPSNKIDACCFNTLKINNTYHFNERTGCEDEKEGDGKGIKNNLSLRKKIQDFCEGDGSCFSTAFIFISILFVIASVLSLILGSVRELQVPMILRNKSEIQILYDDISKYTNVYWEPHPFFIITEHICIIWFTFEFLLRLIVADNRIRFMSSLLNFVDFISIFPFYLELCLLICGFDVSNFTDIKGAFLVVRIMRVLRVVRILKLGRYSSGMRTFALTLRSSARQLGMMGMVLSTAVIFFSTLVYFVEKDEINTPFTSIPAAFWWSIVSLTTVGYGDVIPVTTAGKLIASGAIISGVLVLALPITIIVDNFMKVTSDINPNPLCNPNRYSSSINYTPGIQFSDDRERNKIKRYTQHE